MRTDGEREKSGSEKPREEGVSKELQKGIEGERKRERRKGYKGVWGYFQAFIFRQAVVRERILSSIVPG